ncbi:MAG: hypothetical protein V4668_00950 [Patescibacteria group bacterium]
MHHICIRLFFVVIILFSLQVHTAETASAATATSTPTVMTTHDAVAVEKRVREYFADIPVMIEIARCESKFRQFTDSGSVLRGGGNAGMVGIFQFYEIIHKKAALALGFDIDTVEGNLGYARHLYTQSGHTPWASCVPDVIPVATTLSTANKELQIKLLTQVLTLLQELLKMELARR